MKRVIILVIAVICLIPVIVNAAFSDLPDNHWAASSINELVEQKVISGYPDGTFKPNNTLTKGEYLKLVMAASLPELDFSLVQKDFNHWAAAYVKVAENYNLVDKGEININNINEPINRMDVIRIMSLADISIKGNEQKSVDYLKFVDISDLSAKETILLSHAVANEIIGGYPDGTFKPQNNLTRAEGAKILSVYIKK